MTRNTQSACPVRNVLSGYNISACQVVLCFIVGVMSLHIIHVSSYTFVEIMIVGNADLYIVFARFYNYFIV
jgi:hypothetical protein